MPYIQINETHENSERRQSQRAANDFLIRCFLIRHLASAYQRSRRTVEVDASGAIWIDTIRAADQMLGLSHAVSEADLRWIETKSVPADESELWACGVRLAVYCE